MFGLAAKELKEDKKIFRHPGLAAVRFLVAAARLAAVSFSPSYKSHPPHKSYSPGAKNNGRIPATLYATLPAYAFCP